MVEKVLSVFKRRERERFVLVLEMFRGSLLIANKNSVLID